jgi:hypothetical protein
MGKMKEFAQNVLDTQSTTDMVARLLDRVDHAGGTLIGVPTEMLVQLSNVLECEHVNRLATAWACDRIGDDELGI